MSDQTRHLRIEPSPKRIRGFHGGQLVVDSTDVQLVWEIPYFPWWYFPLADVRAVYRVRKGLQGFGSTAAAPLSLTVAGVTDGGD